MTKTYNATEAQKIQEAADHIDAAKVAAGWVYFDDSTRKHYLCDSAEDMVDLYDLLHDEEVANDAYSHWCAGTSHTECDADGNPLR